MFGRLNILVLFIVFPITISSQTKLKGVVVDSNNMFIGDVLIALVDDKTQNIISYVKTSDDGEYELVLFEKFFSKKIRIDVINFGYKKQTHFFSKLKKDSLNFKNFKLTSENIILNEVIVESSPIKIKKDTIEFKASKFIQGNEENIEDLLRKIPGLIVEKDGKIKYGKREVEKVMVDNEDLFGKGYKLLTKNLPVNPVDKIEVLKSFSDNSLLKGIEKSNKIALNLKLKKNFKRIWFGNLKSNLSVGSTKGFYNLNTNLMNFGKKNKHYLLTNFNNTGFETIGDVSEILTSIDFEGYYDGGETKDLMYFDIPNTFFSSERTNFNDSELVSSSSIFNFSKNTKLKLVSFFNTDETLFFKNRYNKVNTKLFKYSYEDNTTYKSEKRDLLGKLEFTTSFFPKKDELLFRAAYKNNTSEKKSELEYNRNNTQEFLNAKNELFDVDLRYTNKINNNEALVFNTKYNFKTIPQKYNVNRFFYNELIRDYDNIREFNQISEIESKRANLSLNYLRSTSSKKYLNLEIGNHYVEDILKTNIFLVKENSVRQKINGFTNNVKNQLNDLFFKSIYSINFQDFELRGELNFNYLISSLDVEKSFFYVNPLINFNWNLNKRSRIYSELSYNSDKLKINDIYDGYINVTFQNFLKGVGGFQLLSSSRLLLGYEFGNPNDDLRVKTNLSLTRKHDYLSSNTTVGRDYFKVDKIVFKDGADFSINNQIEYYFAKISSNLKFGIEYSQNNFKNLLNNSLLREVEYSKFGYKVEFRSAFNNFFNYHLGTKLDNSSIKSSYNIDYKAYISFLNLYFSVNDRFDFDINSTSYNLSSVLSKSSVFFLDFNMKYKFPKKRITMGIVGKNILDVRRYEEISISENLYSSLSYELLPRYVLLRVDYNF